MVIFLRKFLLIHRLILGFPFLPILQYHPDVCRGSNCGVQFHRINEAYDVCKISLLSFSYFSNFIQEFY